jgi:TRAP-type uncharacterized transport system substrate-binding protein
MKHSIVQRAGIALFLSVAGLAALSHAAPPRPEEAAGTPGVVVLETEESAGISVRIAEELARSTNDGPRRRILPVVGAGSLQNIMDFKLLNGIDISILQTDVLNYVKEHREVPGIESWITYISKLYNEEFHLIARAEIKSVSDLVNMNVSVGVKGAGTTITAVRVFELLGIPVHALNYDPQEGLEKLRTGDVAAVAIVAGKPAPLFCDLIGENGLHFLPIALDPAVSAGYVSARLTAADYPGMVPYNHPIDTVAVGSLLAVNNLTAGSERYRYVANFVEAFFGGFQSLLQPGRHPKWREVDITGDLPGWRRFPPATQWVQRNARVAVAPNLAGLKADFLRFMDDQRKASGEPPLTQQERDQLFDQFKGWASEHPDLWQKGER